MTNQTGDKPNKQGGIKDIAIGRSDIYRMAPGDLFIKDGWNSRTVNFSADDADDIALARSIAEVGVKQPLTVFFEDGKTYISDGHRRHGATLYAIEHFSAEIKSVPVQTEDRYSSEADRIFSQVVRNSGKPLAPIELARVFKRLLDFGWSVGEVATKSGLNAGWVTQLLELQASAPDVQQLVSSGRVSATLAIERLKTDGDQAGTVLADAVKTAEAAGKTRATKKHIARGDGADKVPPKETKADRLRTLLGSEVVWSDGYGDGGYHATFTADQYAEFRSLIGF